MRIQTHTRARHKAALSHAHTHSDVYTTEQFTVERTQCLSYSRLAAASELIDSGAVQCVLHCSHHSAHSAVLTVAIRSLLAVPTHGATYRRSE
jgi:hypothetical protein